MQGIIDAPLTMSGVIKELQVLKDKFKNEDDEEGALALITACCSCQLQL